MSEDPSPCITLGESPSYAGGWMSRTAIIDRKGTRVHRYFI